METDETSAARQAAFQPLLLGVVLAIMLTLFLRETGPAAARPAPVAATS